MVHPPISAPDENPGDLLPGRGPVTVIVGCADPLLTLRTVELLAPGTSLDPGQRVVQVAVDEGRAALERTVLETPEVARGRVRLMLCPTGADPVEVVTGAVLAPTLSEWGHRLTDAEVLPHASPRYGVRYQPIVDLASGTAVGYEALITARAGDRELDVEALLDRATRGGWLAELDRLGRSLALGGIGPWLGGGLLFLNVLAPDGGFDESALNDTLARAERLGLDPDQLVLEATERNRYSSLPDAVAQMDRIRSRGVRLAIDDVGSGWASLEVVTRFRPDVLKLSGQLISQLPGQAAAAAVGAVVSMAHQLGTWVVGEGVETSEQADGLRALGVDWAQGHLFGRPVELAASVEPPLPTG